MRKDRQANAQGEVDEWCTGLPFGNDLNNPVSTNCTVANAQSNPLQTNDDASEHHFTQKERDSDTGNDYFVARYYTSALGRFIAPDWSAKTDPVPYAVFTNPQSLNLYAYVRNNPLVQVDMDGHCEGFECLTQANWIAEHQIGDWVNQGRALLAAFLKVPPQQTYGRQPNGSYKADPAKVRERINSNDNKPIGNGQCVAACHQFSGVTDHTESWTLGDDPATKLNDTTDVGLAIATKGPNGKYTQPDRDQNSGIYMGHDQYGRMLMVDQWPYNPEHRSPFLHQLWTTDRPGSTKRGSTTGERTMPITTV